MADVGDNASGGILSQMNRDLAELVGHSENTTRFLVCLLLGFPLALIPKNFFHNVPANVQHIFFTFIGLALSYFNFGAQTIHYLITILANYVLLSTIGGSKISVVVSFIFNMVYFIAGTYSVQDGSHEVMWDSPHCVMVLKMMGVAFDLYDGQKEKESLSAEQKMHFLIRAPTLLELSGFCFFFAGFLAGPHYSLRLYINYTNDNLIPEWERKHPSNVVPCITRFLSGVAYVCIGISLNFVYPDSHLLSTDFVEKGLLHKLFTVFVWGTAYRTRYMGIWLFTEGICILTGLAYNGLDSKGCTKWDGLTNGKIKELETAITFRTLVASYNITTNKWAGRYIYKRCRFLGNKQLSQFLALMFLAAWHGLYIGYFHCFLCEMFCINFEEQWQKVWKKLGLSWMWDNPILSLLMAVFCNFFVMTSFAYSLVSFQLCKWFLFSKVYSSMYYCGHIWYIGWMFLFPFVIKPLLGKEPRTEKPSVEDKSK